MRKMSNFCIIFIKFSLLDQNLVPKLPPQAEEAVSRTDADISGGGKCRNFGGK